ARINWDGVRLNVFNVHLGLNQRQRDYQLRYVMDLVQLVANAGEPVLLAGDFNDWNRKLHTFMGERCGCDNVLESAASVLGGRDLLPTWPAAKPFFALDRLYTRNLKVVQCGRLEGDPWSHLSDHLPLRAVLTV